MIAAVHMAVVPGARGRAVENGWASKARGILMPVRGWRSEYKFRMIAGRFSSFFVYLWVVVCFVFSIGDAEAEPSSGWRSGNYWHGPVSHHAYGNGRYVSAGRDILVSKEGLKWFPGPLFSRFEVTGLTFARGLFVASAASESASGNLHSGRVLVSTDGFTWEEREISTKGATGIGYLEGSDEFLVYVGDEIEPGAVLVSKDLITWRAESHYTQPALPEIGGVVIKIKDSEGILASRGGEPFELVLAGRFSHVTPGDGEMIAVSKARLESSRLVADSYVTTDGITWRKLTLPLSESIPIETSQAFRKSYLGIAGRLLYAMAPGEGWRAISLGKLPEIESVTRVHKIAIVTDFRTKECWVSADGLAWKKMSEERKSVTAGDLKGVAYGNQVFVAGGTGMVISRDGWEWEAVPNMTTVIDEITFGNGQFVAASHGKIHLSENGLEWRTVNLGAGSISVTAGMDSFIAMRSSFPRVNFFSRDGLTWETMAFDGLILGFANGKYFGQKGLHFYCSTDGLNWEEGGYASGDDTTWRTVAGGNGVYIMAGSDQTGNSTIGDTFEGLNAISADGIAWSLFEGDWMKAYRMAYRGGYTLRDASLNDIAFGDGMFVMVGESGNIAFSKGANWHAAGNIRLQDLNGVTYGDGKFVMVGDGGTILTLSSAPRLEWVSTLNGADLRLWGMPGREYEIQVAERLDGIDWQPLQSATLLELGETAKMPLVQPARFYRAVLK